MLTCGGGGVCVCVPFLGTKYFVMVVTREIVQCSVSYSQGLALLCR